MDSFMDKLTHKFNSSEAIRANAEADAKSLENAKALNAQYAEAISEIRRLSLKCVETNEATTQLVAAGIEKIEAFEAGKGESGLGEEGTASIKQAVTDGLKEQEDFIHKESVRVYRNVQASVVDELKLQTEALALQNARLEAKLSGLKPVAVISLILSALTFAGIAAAAIMLIINNGSINF